MKLKRITALILCVCLALSLSASSAFIVREKNHCCSGEDCAVCAHIAALVYLLRSFSLFGIILSAIPALLIACDKCHSAFRHAAGPTLTLVAWKIRLNN